MLTTANATRGEAARARRGLIVVFSVYGMLIGSWVSRVPFITQHLDLSTARLSLALLAMPIGQVVAAQVVASLVRSFGSAAVARTAIPFAAVCLVLPGLAWGLGTLALALGLFGLSLGVLEVVMNAQGVVVEQILDRHILSSLHGCFSVGSFVGAGLGALATTAGLDPALHFALVGIVLAVAGGMASRTLLGEAMNRSNPIGDRGADPEPPRSARLLRQPFLLVVGAIAFCTMFAEGSVETWSGLFLHQSLGSSLAVAPYGVVASGAGMAVGRFSGERLIARWGARRVLEVGASLASVGMAVSLVAEGPAVAVAGYAIFGLGTSTLVPIAFTMAGNVEGVTPAWAISRVSSMGFVALFGAPPIIGFIAESTSLRLALGVAALLVSLVLPLSFVARRARPRNAGVELAQTLLKSTSGGATTVDG